MEFQNTSQYTENLEPIGTSGQPTWILTGPLLHLTALQPSHSPPPLPSLSSPHPLPVGTFSVLLTLTV